MENYSMNSKDFYRALENAQLIGSKCNNCGTYSFPQRQICPKCHSDQTEITLFSGAGRLAAYTVIFVPTVKMAEAGYDSKNPYCVGIVTLDEGPRVAAQILNVDLIHPENINIGTEMKMTAIKRQYGNSEETFLAFKAE